MEMDRRSVMLAGAVVALGFASSSRAASPVKVSIPDDKSAFEPAEVRVKVGEFVEWTNHAIIGHTVTCDPRKAKDGKNVSLPSGASAFDSGELAGEQTWRHQFTVPGRYRYFCILHEGMGMVGEVVVDA